MTDRVGFGYDVHATAEGRPLVLGGVRFDSKWGLEGYSDADVIAHAIGDALLGAAALGDLGVHFPPGEPKWKDVSSLVLLTEIARMLQVRGFRIGNVDATLLAERPSLGPRRDEMRRRLAEALGISPDQVSVKATTNERLGFVGRQEGLAAMAVARIVRDQTP
ncbi:MAG: 2-C-methyl-D-erythritol 2,4-cyclodiphosphate synthase [Candidatus Eisenbacteria bacterium]|nr:2-C-methyl-D-erythritol 2,4-cyclodiphosphate synthase [Candidatus Eisenbacteria bacterium]